MDDFRKISLLEKLSAEGSNAATLRRAQKYAERLGGITGRLTPEGARAAGLPVPDRWTNAGPEATTEIAPGETERNLALNKRLKARTANKQGGRRIAEGIPGAVGSTRAVLETAKGKAREVGNDISQAAGDAAGWAKRGLGIARERVRLPAANIQARSPEQQAKEKAHQERAMSAKPSDKPASPGLGTTGTPTPAAVAAQPAAKPVATASGIPMGRPDPTPVGNRSGNNISPGTNPDPKRRFALKATPPGSPSIGGGGTAKPTPAGGGSSLGQAMTRGPKGRQYASGKEWMATTAGRKKAWGAMKGKPRRKSQNEWWKGHTSTRSKAGDKWAANRDKKRGAASAVAKAKITKTAPTPKKTGPIARKRILGGAISAAATPLRQVPGYTPRPMGTDIFAAGQKKTPPATQIAKAPAAPPAQPAPPKRGPRWAGESQGRLLPPTPTATAGMKRGPRVPTPGGAAAGTGPNQSSANLLKARVPPKPQPALPSGGMVGPIKPKPAIPLAKPAPQKGRGTLGPKKWPKIQPYPAGATPVAKPVRGKKIILAKR